MDINSVIQVTFDFADNSTLTTAIPAGRMEVCQVGTCRRNGEFHCVMREIFLPYTPAQILDMACGALPMETPAITGTRFEPSL